VFFIRVWEERSWILEGIYGTLTKPWTKNTFLEVSMVLEKISKHKARKIYSCCVCGKPIQKGQEYSRLFRKFTDTVETNTACLSCRR